MRLIPLRLVLPLAAIALGAAACAYSGQTSNPIALSNSWFSYLDAGDLRKACVAGAPEAYRIAFNGSYEEQLRTYDVTAIGPGGARMAVRVRGSAGNVANFKLSEPFQGWTGDQTQVPLTAADVTALRQSLADSNAFSPTPEGLELKSRRFYWIVAACRGGHFTYNAWQWPSADYDKLTFPALLARLDRSGVALNPPRPNDRPEFPESNDKGNYRDREFQLRVGKDGISNLVTVF
ncbi:MAG TPA: hypothetical protein VGO34_14475 [Alphaproteobacteria bacterium]|jgi:hypothetical protein